MNKIVRCLCEVAGVLAPGARFYASFWEAPHAAHLEPLTQPSGIVTFYDADSYHYAFTEIAWMAGLAGLRAELIGEWGHPRGQHMAAFHRDE
jgi:hypothetical protein